MQTSVAYAILNGSENYEIDDQRKALSIIEKIADGDGTDAFPAKWLIKGWHEKNPVIPVVTRDGDS